MTGCGIRALRWSLEAYDCGVGNEVGSKNLELWVNDADVEKRDLIERNLKSISRRGILFHLFNEPAQVILSKAFLEKRFFDLVDIDCFGSPNHLLQPVMQVLAFEGVMALTSTDGRSLSGHERKAAIRSFSSAVRAHPCSWEIALRLQLATVARQAWLLGRGIEPLISFSDGRVFRLFVRFKKKIVEGEEKFLGFLARCNSCGAQATQPLLTLTDWPSCDCGDLHGKWSVIGPLWIGPLQALDFLTRLQFLANSLQLPIVNRSKKLIKEVLQDEGLPVFCWSTSELARRTHLSGPPPTSLLVKDLRDQGYQAFRSCVMPGQVRSDAPIKELLRVCREKYAKGL